jgi:hypothetical protein
MNFSRALATAMIGLKYCLAAAAAIIVTGGVLFGPLLLGDLLDRAGSPYPAIALILYVPHFLALAYVVGDFINKRKT